MKGWLDMRIVTTLSTLDASQTTFTGITREDLRRTSGVRLCRKTHQSLDRAWVSL